MWVYTPQCCVTMAPLILPSPQNLKLQPERSRAAESPRPTTDPPLQTKQWLFFENAWKNVIRLVCGASLHVSNGVARKVTCLQVTEISSTSNAKQVTTLSSSFPQESRGSRAAPGATSFSDTRIGYPGAHGSRGKAHDGSRSETGLPLKSLWAKIGRKWGKHETLVYRIKFQSHGRVGSVPGLACLHRVHCCTEYEHTQLHPFAQRTWFYFLHVWNIY